MKHTTPHAETADDPAALKASVHATARAIEEYQKTAGLSDRDMLRAYPGLGSTKTYRKILAQDFEQMDLERQHENYAAVWSLIENSGPEREGAELYDDFSLSSKLRKAYLDARRTRGLDRFVLVLGDSGVGKTSAADALRAKWGASAVVRLEASAAWGWKPIPLLRAILRALGQSADPRSAAEGLDQAIARLNERRVCLVIDEAHHLAPAMLDVVKTLINQTPGEFILIALPSLWAKLESRAYVECRQLIGNRLNEVIRHNGVEPGDVRKLLERGLPAATADLNGGFQDIAKTLAAHAPRFGNLAFVRDVIARIRETSPKGEPLTREHVVTHINQEVASRQA